MATLATAAAASDKPPRPKRRIPVSLRIFMAALALVGIGRLFLSSWNSRTYAQFMKDARAGELAKCRSMLAEDHTSNEGTRPVILDSHALQVAANESDRIRREPLSVLDYARGRQRYSAHLAAFNDHSISVEWGRVRLGSSFWLYVPPGPEFRLKKQARDVEE